MERFEGNTDRRPGHGPNGDCWRWCGAIQGLYGSIFVNGRNRQVHRFAYELVKGPIPHGLEIDHRCGVRLCVNPAHLEAVTHAENLRRQRPKDRVWPRKRWTDTHCGYGHELTPANLYVSRSGKRVCRACNRIGQRRFVARHREDVA